MSDRHGIRSFAESTWTEIADLSKRTEVALVPVGQTVEHGPHLPVGTDVFQAEAVCRRVASELEVRGFPVLLGPAMAFGSSLAQETIPGFVNLRPETLTELLVDVCSSLSRQGFSKQVLILFGPSGWASAQMAASRLRSEKRAQLFVIGGLESSRCLSGGVLEGHLPEQGMIDTHAGELETSLMLAIDAEKVRMDKAVTSYSSLQTELHKLPLGNVSLAQRMMSIGLWDWSCFGKSGVSGAAALATKEKGEELLNRLAVTLAEHVIRYVFAEGADISFPLK